MRTLDGKLIAMGHLMFFQSAFGHKTFTALFADERAIARMYGTNMRLHIDNFAKSLIAKLARMHIFQIVRQMYRFVDVQFFQGVKSFWTLAAHKWFVQSGMTVSHVNVELTLFLEFFITYGAPAKKEI